MTRYQVGNRWIEGARAAVMSIASALMHAIDSMTLNATTVESLVVAMEFFFSFKTKVRRTTCRPRNGGR